MKSHNLFRLAGAAILGALVFALPLTLSAQSASAYVKSGLEKFREGNLDGAIADYTQALDLNSSYLGAYNNRGLARSAQGNFDGAIADYSTAIKMKPAYVEAYYNRGMAAFLQGNYDAAIADFTKTLELKPDHQSACCYRAMAREGQGNFEGARADYAKAFELKGGDDKGASYLVLHNALLTRRLGRGIDERLKAVTGWSDGWTKSLAQFLSDQLSEADLRQRASVAAEGQKARQQSEALYFAGVVKVIAGNKAAARADLQQCFDSTGPAALMHRLARTELDRP